MWELFEAATGGLSEAAAIRVAFHLGKGDYELAKISAYKALFLSVILSVFITSVFFMLGDSLGIMLTRDLLLRDMLNEAIPMIGKLYYILLCFGLCDGNEVFFDCVAYEMITQFLILDKLSLASYILSLVLQWTNKRKHAQVSVTS